MMLQHVFRLYCLPKDIVWDRGPQFLFHFWNAFCNLFGVSVSLSSGYHLQTNRRVEPRTREGTLLSQTPSLQSKQLIWVEYAHHSLPCSSSCLSPFKCAYGYQPPLFPTLEKEAGVPSAMAFFIMSECCKLYPRFVAPFLIFKLINTVAVRLRLPRAMRVQLTFHITHVNP